jgi:hypothetical protein
LIYAGSRSRWLLPNPGRECGGVQFSDNFGFAQWVETHADELAQLGPGRHFGEWWGQGIQRGYSLSEKRFSLFNTIRWADRHMGELIYTGDGAVGPVPCEGQAFAPACCHVAPVLYRGLFHPKVDEDYIARLRHEGSLAAPGFMKPEGIVVYHVAAGVGFKKTLEKDGYPKSQQP